jgi:hypothetical protein
VDVHEISPSEVKKLFPLAKVDDIRAGFYVKEDGRVNPVDATMALVGYAHTYSLFDRAAMGAILLPMGRVSGEVTVAVLVHEHRDHALGLVKREIDFGFGSLEELALDLDRVLAQFSLVAELGDLAVDGDEALYDELLGLAAGADPGLGEDLLDAFGAHGGFLG